MRIVVVGAGIAGLASAFALARGGHEITLLERRTGFGETGAGIQLSPNATGVLLAMGLGPGLGRVAREPEGVVVRSLASGREIGGVALGDAARARYGAPFLVVARADLHALLLDAVRGHPAIRIRIGRAVADVTAGKDACAVLCESAGGARETLPADLVVGADGLWSRVRAALGDDRRPTYSGYAAYRATLPVAQAPPEASRQEIALWLGPGCHVVHYPIADGRRLNVVVVARRPDPLDGWSAATSVDSVAAILARTAAPVRELAAGPEPWSAWSLYDLPVRALVSDRIALVGDAGHPVLPYLAQGGSLAVEDAACLAARLGPDPAGVPAALGRYGRDRLSRVDKVQGAARRNGRAYHAGRPVAFVRDAVMRRLGPAGMRDRYDWLYGWRPPEPVPA